MLLETNRDTLFLLSPTSHSPGRSLMAPIWLWYRLLFGIKCTPRTLHHLHRSTFDLNFNVANRCQLFLHLPTPTLLHPLPFKLQARAPFPSGKCTGILYLVLHFNMHKQRIFIAAASNDSQWHCSVNVHALTQKTHTCAQFPYVRANSSFGIRPTVGLWNAFNTLMRWQVIIDLSLLSRIH